MMKRLLLWLVLAGLLLATTDGQSDQVTSLKMERVELAPQVSRNFTQEFQGEKRATALAMGIGASYLGLYVYDSQGNCVAWDDTGDLATCDDLAVNWLPREKAVYTIEVFNAGYLNNHCRVIMR